MVSLAISDRYEFGKAFGSSGRGTLSSGTILSGQQFSMPSEDLILVSSEQWERMIAAISEAHFNLYQLMLSKELEVPETFRLEPQSRVSTKMKIREIQSAKFTFIDDHI